MKILELCVCFVIAANSMFAQQVISSAGETYSNINGSIAFTIGEVVIFTGTNGTTNLTQGFHQFNCSFECGSTDNAGVAQSIC